MSLQRVKQVFKQFGQVSLHLCEKQVNNTGDNVQLLHLPDTIKATQQSNAF